MLLAGSWIPHIGYSSVTISPLLILSMPIYTYNSTSCDNNNNIDLLCINSLCIVGKDSPSSKLLFAKDIPLYRQLVVSFYENIQTMPQVCNKNEGYLISYFLPEQSL